MMNKANLILFSGFCFLASCGGAKNEAPTNASADTVIAQSAETEPAVAPQPEETVVKEGALKPYEDGKIVLKEVLDLLVDNKLVPFQKSDYQNEKIETNYISIDKLNPDVPSGDDAFVWHVACLKKLDGTYQVLYFDNSDYGIDALYEFVSTDYSSYIYDGKSLTKNDFQLPRPRYTDFFTDAVLYSNFKPEYVKKIKNERVGDKTGYEYHGTENNGGRLSVYGNVPLIVEKDKEWDFQEMKLMSVDYVWNGKDFIREEGKDRFPVVSRNNVGSFRIGDAYSGQPVDGYEVVNEGGENGFLTYLLKQNGKTCLEFETKNGKICSMDVYSPKFKVLSLGLDTDLGWYCKGLTEKFWREADAAYFEHFGVTCHFSADDIVSSKTAADGSLTDVVVKAGAKAFCLSVRAED